MIITQAKQRWLFLAAIIIDKTSQILRILLRNEWFKKCGHNWNEKSGVKYLEDEVKSNNVFCPGFQRSCKKGNLRFYLTQIPLIKSGDIEKWDVILLFNVLRFSMSIKLNYEQLNAIQKLSECRNEFGHSLSTNLSQEDYDRISKIVIENLILLGAKQSDLDDVLNIEFDS
jgi:hypothetical protein